MLQIVSLSLFFFLLHDEFHLPRGYYERHGIKVLRMIKKNVRKLVEKEKKASFILFALLVIRLLKLLLNEIVITGQLCARQLYILISST